ncbi:MAG TPA: zf-HC2 domain-containing protein [Blastocatellia bacterium]|nr:zf-HC2 domain-containing protein [Blastocatellia bacterium]
MADSTAAPAIEGEMADECPEIEVLTAYVEGAVSPRQKAYLESHLAWCSACRGLVGMLVRSKSFVPDHQA